MPLYHVLVGVPTALTIAALMDAGLCATSALGRGVTSTRISPLTPQLCAVMVVVFTCVCTTQIPLMGSVALRDLNDTGRDAGLLQSLNASSSTNNTTVGL